MNLGLYILFPCSQEFRYIYPLLPFYLYFAAQGMLAVGRSLSAFARTERQRLVLLRAMGVAPAALAVALIAYSFWQSAGVAWGNMANHRESGGPLDHDSSEMFAFIRNHTGIDVTVIFFKPRALRLFTDRRSFATERPEDVAKGDYLVLHKDFGGACQVGATPPATPGCTLDMVFSNGTYRVYRISANGAG